jgi:hypothetical protein
LTNIAAAPPGALTWESPAERKRKLAAWQRAVMARFGEQGRTMRVCWVLSSLFVKHGFCFATNGVLADMTLIAENKIQQTLKDLEDGRAITRGWITHANGRKQRVIYPARALTGTPNLGVGGPPAAGGPYL